MPGLFPPGWSTSSCGWCMAAVQKAGTARYGRTLLRCGLCAQESDAIHGCCCTLMSLSGHIVPGLFVGCWGTYLLQTTESSDHDVDPQDDPVLALQKLLGMKLWPCIYSFRQFWLPIFWIPQNTGVTGFLQEYMFLGRHIALFIDIVSF